MEENNSLIQTETNWEDAYSDQRQTVQKNEEKVKKESPQD